MKESRDPVKRSEYAKKYYEENSEFVKQQVKLYKENNLDKVKESGRLSQARRKELDPELAKRRARSYALKRKYGITLEQYEQLLEKQGGCCAICDRHFSLFKTNLAVDHSHRSNRIRGLLCTACNYRLVARHEDPALLRKIADYLEQGTEWYAPEKKKRKANAKRKPNNS